MAVYVGGGSRGCVGGGSLGSGSESESLAAGFVLDSVRFCLLASALACCLTLMERPQLSVIPTWL